MKTNKMGCRRKVIIAILLTLCCNPISLCLTLAYGSAAATLVYNEAVMVRFAYPFFTYPLPDDTVETGRRTTIIRHGNVGCSFVAVRIVRSELTHEQLEAYFEDIGFAMPHGEPFFMDDEGLVRVLVWEDGPFYRLALIGGGAYIMDWPRIGCR